jgi:hypothetical protein
MHRTPVLAGSGLLLLLLAGPLAADQEDLDTQLMRATVKISHEKSAGTGFFLCRPDPHAPERHQFVLVTAAHVFENIPGDRATLYFRTRESEGVYKKVAMELAIRADGKPRWTKHPSEDVAVLVVVPPKEADLPELAVDLLATDESLKTYGVHPGDTLACLGYPHRVEANEAGFPILRTGPIASFPLTPARANRTFLLSSNTFEGDSGGPVYLADPRRFVAGKDRRQEVRLILGLVTGQHFLDEEMKMVYGTTKLRHRLGLAIVVQASFIREALDRLPLKAASRDTRTGDRPHGAGSPPSRGPGR